MGDGLTGDLRTFDGTNDRFNPTTFKNITSHEARRALESRQSDGVRTAAAGAQRLIRTIIG
jgi:hypothetical protein